MRKVLLIAMALLLVTSASMAAVHGKVSVKDIQYVANPATSDASPLANDTVTVEGYVTFEPLSMNTDGRGFFLADSAGAWHGIYVYKSSAGWDLGFGWKVRVTGKVSEYNGFTELAPWTPDSVTVLSDTTDWANLPEACTYTVVPAADLSAVGTAEQYESVLVQVEDVTTSNPDLGYGEWEVSDASSNAVVIDNPQNSTFGYFHKVIDGQSYDYIRGPLQYNYGAYKVTPEIGHDLRVDDTVNGQYQQFSYFQQQRPMDLKVRVNADGAGYIDDWSPVMKEGTVENYGSSRSWACVDDTIKVLGVITMEDGASYAGAGNKFLMADATYGLETGAVEQPWSSVMVYNADSTAFPTLPKGFVFECRALVGEFVNATESTTNMSELFLQDFKPPTIGLTYPAPAQLTTADIRDPRVAEKYENAFVYVKQVSVVNNYPGTTHTLFVVDDPSPDATPGFGIDDDSNDSSTPYYTKWQSFEIPVVGTVVDSVKGWVYSHSGDYLDTDGSNWTYKVSILDPSTDITFGEAPPTIGDGGRAIASPAPTDAVDVGYNITDNVQVDSAKVWYRVGMTGDWTGVAMTSAGTDSFAATIPAQAEGSDVWYFVQSWDDGARYSISPSDTSRFMYGYHVTANDLTIEQIQWTPYSGGRSRYEGYTVTVSGVVTDSSNAAFAYGYISSSNKPGAYYLQSGSTPEWSSIVVNLYSDDMPVSGTVEMGDNITVTGEITETTGGDKFADNTRMINIGANFTINSSGNSLTYHEVPVADLTGTPETYESQLVKVVNPTFVQVNTYDWTFEDASGNEFLVDDDVIKYASNNSLISNWFAGLADGTSDQTPGSIQGIWIYSYGTWKLEPRDWYDVEGLTPDAAGELAALPKSFELFPVYPNPFNPSTTVAFQLPKNSAVKVVVYNMLGQQVKTLIDQPMVAGRHAVVWHGVSDSNAPVASGVYFLRFDAGNYHKMQKMVLVK